MNAKTPRTPRKRRQDMADLATDGARMNTDKQRQGTDTKPCSSSVSICAPSVAKTSSLFPLALFLGVLGVLAFIPPLDLKAAPPPAQKSDDFNDEHTEDKLKTARP